MPPSDSPTRALPTLHEFFSPGGILARSSLPYEYRPGQLEMAKAVERALEERRHLIVEAGTGTGKTLAYLLPALRTGQRIIVSTGTKALQDQLYFRDVPFLETLLGELRVCYMKGRANYLCRHKLAALRNQPILSGLEEIDQYRQICRVGRDDRDRRPCRAFRDARSRARCGKSWMRGPRPAWGRPARITGAASSPRCGGGRWNRTSSSSTTTCFSPTFPSSRRPRERPTPAFCRRPRRWSSTRRTSWKRWRRATSASRSATFALRNWRAIPMCCCAARRARKTCPPPRSNSASAPACSLPRCL